VQTRTVLGFVFFVLLLFAINSVQSYRYSMLRKEVVSLEQKQKEAFEKNKSKLILLTKKNSAYREQLLQSSDDGLYIGAAKQIIIIEPADE